MKKSIFSLVILSTLSLLIACSNNPNNSINASDPSSEVSSAESGKSSESSKSIESKNSSESKEKDYKDDELSTEAGLTIKFNKTGASISTIKWGNSQIAKDGFVVGRCANRIANGKFSINGTQYTIPGSNPHSLHGGQGTGMNSWRGPFATKDWTKVEQTKSYIIYTIESADGENGYPGKMNMTVKYTLSQEGELLIEYNATTTKDTLCNPTNHLFMAMNGNNSYDNLKLWIDADNYTPLNNQIPTGEIKSVTNTQFDYTTEKAFDKSKNYDDNYVLNGEGYRKVASLTGTSLGVKVEVFTDRPGLQLYKDGSGNICLETQMFPDAINHENFTSPILRAGEEFYSKTAYTFTKIA